MGTAPFAVPALQALGRGPDQVVGVVTRPDARAGRGRTLRASPVKVAAGQLGLPVFQPARVSSEEGAAVLSGLAPDVLLVAAFGELLRQEVLVIPRIGSVNLHASLLPRYRGAAPIQRAILAGERETGVTAQWMTLALDAGDVILQRSLAIGTEEDFGSLHERLAAAAAEVALQALALVRTGSAPRIPQSAEGVSYAPPIRREELVLDWQQPADELARAVRAFSPRPGARTTRAGSMLKVLAARSVGRVCAPRMPAAPQPSATISHPELSREAARSGQNGTEPRGMPGRIVESTKEGFGVAAGRGVLWALRVQPEGRGVMSAADYVKGYRLSVGERLGTRGPGAG
jgi:methionyl-tRNA formyltransferase